MTIIGECPYCDKNHIWNESDDQYGKFTKVSCIDGCEKTYWIYLTHTIPYALTDEAFHEKYIVDEDSKNIRLKNPLKPMTELQSVLYDIIGKAIAQQMANDIIGVEPLKPSESLQKHIEDWKNAIR